MKAFGKKLREVRLDKGFTQEELANECDFPPSQISRIETGSINTSISHIIKIAQVLKVKLKDLMDFKI
ncbi:MAG: helix-turn-helix transcriptional regulator [Flavipsychrobacter sp.]|nr:helix-turn-helix transcriptional regulator [Flavipsychrobacter sp.]